MPSEWAGKAAGLSSRLDREKRRRRPRGENAVLDELLEGLDMVENMYFDQD